MASDKHRDFLDERAQTLLRILVDKYIRDGQPVGSRTLSRDSGLDLSPATIRNIVADLEELGFVSSPHTSAGRVPTNKGYRFFVDTLIKLTPPNGEDLLRFTQGLHEAGRGSASARVVRLQPAVGGDTASRHRDGAAARPDVRPRQIEFLPLSGKRVLAILVVNDREVQNKIVNVQRDFSADELRQRDELPERAFQRPLAVAGSRAPARRAQEEPAASMNALMIEAIEMAHQVFPDSEPEPEFVMAGETNLMGLEALADVETLKGLFEAFGGSATSCICSTRACARKACRSSSATSRATSSSIPVASSPRRMRRRTIRWGCSESSARPGWPTSE